MARIVYVLGAGFSAPLGLPVITNFIRKARAQYHQDKKEWAHIGKVLERIDDSYRILRYYNLNQDNIEDILSFLEMEEIFRDEKQPRADFLEFIASVIRYHTPDLPVINELWNSTSPIFPPNSGAWPLYGAFVSGIFGLQFYEGAPFQAHNERAEMRHEYAVITLNYDTVLESVASFFSRGRRGGVSFGSKIGEFGGSLSKLHGCVSRGNMMAMSWHKDFRSEHIEQEWKLAHWLLSEANHIRVIGYSLPPGDAYLQYLFRSAARRNTHLQTFDVICLDPTKEVTRRYSDFLRFGNMHRFLNTGTEGYFERIAKSPIKAHLQFSDALAWRYESLENCHSMATGAPEIDD